jgi:membrane peptidoglycan carboxypeptidase
MKMRKTLARLAAAGFLAAFTIAAYYAWELYAAYRFTKEEVLPLEAAAHYPLQISSLTKRQLNLLLKVQDPGFFQHDGVDFSSPGAGITTITQSLVKHLYFDKFKAGIAKIKQTLIARFVLDPLMTKEMQLTRFINTVYLGAGTKGFAQAAEYYFHKDFQELTENQYISLVAMMIAPETFSVEKYPLRNKERVARIKKVVSGEYKPRGLFDLYYGKLDREVQESVPPLSYFESYYD